MMGHSAVMKSVVAAVLVACSVTSAQVDFVFRPQTALGGPIAGKLKWKAAVEPKLVDNAQSMADIALIAGVGWKPLEFLSAEAEYKYVAKGGTPDRNEHRPRFALTLCAPPGGWKLGVRGRLEVRFKEGRDPYARVRGRLKVDFPELARVRFFVYEEPFYEFGDANMYNSNELGAGANITLADRASLCVDVRWATSKSSDDYAWEPGELHLITTFKYAFARRRGQ
jgi:hypothetical protein